MEGVRQRIFVPEGCDLYVRFGIACDDEITGWTINEAVVFDPADPYTALLALTASFDTANKKLILRANATDLDALMASGGGSTVLQYRVKVDPALTGDDEGLRFFYGEFVIGDEGP